MVDYEKFVFDSAQYRHAYDYIHRGIGTDGKPILPYVDLTQESVQELLKERENLKKQLEELAALKPPIVPDGSGNLADQIKKVVDDLDTVFKDLDNGNFPPGDPKTWPKREQERYAYALWKGAHDYLMDGQDTIGGGKFKGNLDNAVTASQTLNDNQKDELAKADMIHKKFVEMAFSISNTLHQILRDIAKKINQG